MTTINLPILRGSGFVLRPFRLNDAASLCEAMNDERVARKVTHIPFPYTREHADTWVHGMSDAFTPASRRVDFAIAEEDDDGGDIMGSVAFINVDGHKAQVSYWLTPAQWGRGVVPSALQQLLTFGFDDMKLVRIFAYVYSENKASARVLEKAGFAFEGTHRKEWCKVIDGVTCFFDSNYYAIVR